MYEPTRIKNNKIRATINDRHYNWIDIRKKLMEDLSSNCYHETTPDKDGDPFHLLPQSTKWIVDFYGGLLLF